MVRVGFISWVSPIATECTTATDLTLSHVKSVSIEYTWNERVNYSLIFL